MEEIKIGDVTDRDIDDLCRICVPSEQRDDPTSIKGMEEKRKWAMEMLQRWGSLAKMAYKGPVPVGQVQYRPLPLRRIVYIYCIYVPEKGHWRQGIATKLLDNLLEEMKKPRVWFDHQPALALVTKTFPGEKPGQYPARSFFAQKGFRQAGENPDFLYYPLTEGFSLAAEEEEEIIREVFSEGERIEYIPQEEDRGKAVLIYGPSFCPFSYPFLKKAETHIQEVAPDIPIRWISETEDPAEMKKRGGFKGCVVNARPIKSFVLDKENFQKEVTEALKMS